MVSPSRRGCDSMSLTKELQARDFLCGIENEAYILDIGKYTSLIIQGELDFTGTYVYDFYKESFYPYSKKTTLFGERLRKNELLNCIDKYLKKKSSYPINQIKKGNYTAIFQERGALLRLLLDGDDEPQKKQSEKVKQLEIFS